jgi:acyl-CoA synthetase (NDP forming)
MGRRVLLPEALRRSGGISVSAVIDEVVTRIIEGARAEGRAVLLDPEGFRLLDALNIPVPRQQFLHSAAALEPAHLGKFPGDRIVVKVVTQRILHKTDVGGVLAVPKEHAVVAAALEGMEQSFASHEVSGFTLNEYIHHDIALGSQLLLGMRWTDDFGPVVTLGPGGIHAEFLAENLKPGTALAVFSPELTPDDMIEAALAEGAITRLVTQHFRHMEARISRELLANLVRKFLVLGSSRMPHDIAEFEINPLALSSRGPVALDVLVKLGDGRTPVIEDRPIHKIRHLLEPGTIGLIGVSRSRNPGRIILENILQEGFSPDRMCLVKPGTDSIQGVRCYPSVTSLPEKVDLFVVSVAAARVPEIIQEVIGSEKAESMIVVPGGLGERSGTEPLEQGVRFAIAKARASSWQGPVISGGNCLGVRSVPGGYNATFIPEYKIRSQPGRAAPLAVISQSGAFAAARASRLASLNPRYLISVGNQSDLTVGDYLSYLKDDSEVEIFACYVEGFRPLDGRRWLAAATEITASGRNVILYRAGRTATASHTASVAGDYSVTRELAHTAGVVVAETLADFDDVTHLACYLNAFSVAGWRLGAVSNAGFECVAVADTLGRFYLPSFTKATKERLDRILRAAGIDSVVGVQNPLDLTPITGDALFAEATRAVLEDGNVDVGIIGCVPMTGALNTLEPGDGHSERLDDEDAIVNQIARVRRATSKAWIAVVDGGPLYDAMAAALQRHGVPTFRTMDRALRVFEKYCRGRLQQVGSQISTLEEASK